MILLLRTCTSGRVIVLLAVVTAVAVLHRDPLWLGEWNWTTDWFNGATILTGPLVAGCAAYDSGAFLSRRHSGAIRSLKRGGSLALVIVLTNGVIGCCVQLLALMIGFGLNVAVGAGGTPGLRAIPLAMVLFFACAAFGVLAGHLLGNPIGSPVAAVTLFVFTLLGAKGGNPFIAFRPGGVTGSLVGLTWNPEFLLLTLATLLTLTACCVGAVAYLTSPIRGTRRTVLLVSATIALILSGGVMSASTADRFTTDASAVEYTCAGESPQVCLDTRTSRSLSSLAATMGELARVLTDAGADVPDNFSQVVPGHSLPTSSAPLDVSEDINAPGVPVATAANYLTVPEACPQLTAESAPPEAYFVARVLLVEWLLLRTGRLSDDRVEVSPAPRWLRSTAPQQAPWVAETYDLLRTCRLDSITVPS